MRLFTNEKHKNKPLPLIDFSASPTVLQHVKGKLMLAENVNDEKQEAALVHMVSVLQTINYLWIQVKESMGKKPFLNECHTRG